MAPAAVQSPLRADGRLEKRERKTPARRPRGGRGTLTGLDMAILAVVAGALVLLADPIWSVLRVVLETVGVGKTAQHMAGEITFTVLFALGFVGGFQVIGRHRRAVPWKRVGLVKPKRGMLALGLIAGLAAYSIIGLIDGAVARSLDRALLDNPRVFAEGYTATWYTMAQSLLISTAIVPFIEEFFFRGVLFGWLKERIPVIPALVVSALAFSGYHENWDYLLSLFVFGLILGWVYLRTRSLWPAVLAHAAYNLVIDLYGFVSVG